MQYFKILKYLAPRKHWVQPVSSAFSGRFYTPKKVFQDFSNIYCITEEAKESKTPSLVQVLIASQISIEPKGLREARMLINTPCAAL